MAAAGRSPGYLLVFNAGSSSLKFGLFENSAQRRSRLRAAVRDIGRDSTSLEIGEGAENIGGIGDVADAAGLVLDRLADGVDGVKLAPGNVAVTGHRVVHGGEYFSAPVRLDPPALQKLRSLNELAPLHNPHALAVLDRVQQQFPEAPAVAEFDTSFFHDLPVAARSYAIPAEWRNRHAIRRYGFHGIAHQYMCEHLAQGEAGLPRRVITLQLGQGCSLAAIHDGRPVETSMGFTPLEGLVMGTRSGDVDAGILGYMAQQGCRWQEMEELLNRKSGLLGLSGASNDVRELLQLEAEQHHGAKLALDVFCHRIIKYLGAYTAVLGGVDVIGIGGGIGENAAPIRARICSGLSWLGLQLDAKANERCVGETGRISTEASAIRAEVIEVDEERLIARAAHALAPAEDKTPM